MAQSVVYADLNFAASLSPTANACSADPDETDSPYENMPLGRVPPEPVPTAPSPGRWPRHWRVPAGLLAATLLLLLVATVALGACYWQVTRRLQDTSREQAAEQSRLSQEVTVREQRLEKMQLELAWARAEVQRAWQESNSSQLELESQEAKLEHARQQLALLEKELRDSNSTVSELRACVNTDCCPSGWVLYRSKCLFVSVEKKNWWNSCYDCRSKSAQLLVQGGWLSSTMPHFMQNSATYWVGDRYPNQHDKNKVLYDPCNERSFCEKISYGKRSSSFCYQNFPWICEKPPNLSSTSNPSFLS